MGLDKEFLGFTANEGQDQPHLLSAQNIFFQLTCFRGEPITDPSSPFTKDLNGFRL